MTSTKLNEPFQIPCDEERVSELANMIDEYFDLLWPLNRAITGDPVRKTHEIIKEVVTDLETFEVPSGSKVLGWTVPKEWKCNSAYVLTPDGEKICDVDECNLHLVSYSIPYEGKMTLEQLKEHLISWPDQPTAIPYCTSYYNEWWGFCLTDEQLQSLPEEGEYTIHIDTELFEGSMTYSHAIVKGKSDKEVLLTTDTCHPSLANNELSGILTLMALYELVKNTPEEERNLTYRFVWIPETIGSVAYLDKYGDHLLENCIAGYTVICVGIPGPFIMKRSNRGDTLADRALQNVLEHWKDNDKLKVYDFFPDAGSDERQFCSPGFNLPFAAAYRGMYADYKEYHSSLDNKELVSAQAMADSAMMFYETTQVLEENRTLRNIEPFGEPQLGKRGLYNVLGGPVSTQQANQCVLWLCSQCDGKTDLLEISEKSNLSVGFLAMTAKIMMEKGILVDVSEDDVESSSGKQ